MLGIIALLAAAQAPATPAPLPDRMAALYQALCLKAFPNDEALAAAIIARGGVPLPADKVKITLRDDPGMGWTLKDAGDEVLVFLELPPYHACSVRWVMPEQPLDLSAYRKVADTYTASRPGFVTVPPRESDVGGMHIHATDQARMIADGGAESLIAIDQHSTKPDGTAVIDSRFVHQLVVPGTH